AGESTVSNIRSGRPPDGRPLFIPRFPAGEYLYFAQGRGILSRRTVVRIRPPAFRRALPCSQGGNARTGPGIPGPPCLRAAGSARISPTAPGAEGAKHRKG